MSKEQEQVSPVMSENPWKIPNHLLIKEMHIETVRDFFNLYVWQRFNKEMAPPSLGGEKKKQSLCLLVAGQFMSIHQSLKMRVNFDLAILFQWALRK